MFRIIPAKSILSTVKHQPDSWFGLSYNMNLYRGCQHACIYCDSRSACYQLGDLADIRVKQDALAILERELRSKRRRGTVGFGSMNDCYMPIESQLELTRGALQLMNTYRFPVHIITKSHLVARDADILAQISKVYAAVSITITSADDASAAIIEPGASPPSLRFDALRTLSLAGVYCGITMMPLLPFFNDNEENILALVTKAKEVGAKYILAAFGLTMREGQREFFYQQLDEKLPGLRQRYEQTFGDRYFCPSPREKELWGFFKHKCEANGIATSMRFYEPSTFTQHTLF